MGEKVHRNSLQPGYKLHWYTIKEILGQGGFGITYLAFDNNLEEDVAIKEFLPIELAMREGDFSIHPLSEGHKDNFEWGLDRFIKEARTLTKFKHPNVVRVRSVFNENNTAYMVMEFERGESLQEILSRRKTLDEAELMNIIIPLLGGLEVVHQSNFIHRDIKPANIFIREDGSPLLLDFGSARQALGEETKTLTSLVSPGYAPFEQYYSKSDEQGPFTDIYGFGATLYRAVTGLTPMDAVDRSRSILQSSTDTIVTSTEISKNNYSGRFLYAIDHAMKFKPEERPQTVAEWKREFELPDNPIREAKEIEKQITQPGTQAVAKKAAR
ncbi:MAG: serine/threonine protein kinase, partial [Gammaproteobacteria bacterium]